MTRCFDRLIDVKYAWYQHIDYINNRDTFSHTFSYKKPRHLGIIATEYIQHHLKT